MFAYFRGFLREKTPTYAVIECQGVGYLLNISLHTYAALPEPGTTEASEVMLYAHQIVREDNHQLFGFASTSERELFVMLITVNGVGANTARMILSSLDPKSVVAAVISEDTTTLNRIKGIGAKTASRIVLDLKDKVGGVDVGESISKSAHNTLREEALSALLMLGFARNSANKALDKVIKEEGNDVQLEDVIKAALKLL